LDKINVTIEQENKADRTMFKNKSIVLDSNNNLLIAPLLQSIKDDGFNLKEHTINYYSNSDEAFIFLGKDPIAETVSIPIFERDPQQALRIKISPIGWSPPQQRRPSMDIDSNHRKESHDSHALDKYKDQLMIKTLRKERPTTES